MKKVINRFSYQYIYNIDWTQMGTTTHTEATDKTDRKLIRNFTQNVTEVNGIRS